MSLDTPSEPPAAIGPYRILEALGRGGAGAVYRALAPNGQAVAVKLALIQTPDDVPRFQRECRLQKQLGGDGLLPLLDAGQSPAGPYAVLPLVGGGSLQDRLRRGPLPWREAVQLVQRLALVAGRMHAAGVVHRDLKPDNVLLTREGEAWVADLGLSKHADRGRAGAESLSLSKTGGFAGTPGFMAPEQAFDAKAVGPAADVFALGAILYTAIAGREPFAAASVAGSLKRCALGDYDPLHTVAPDVPAWVGEVVARALASEPAERPPTGTSPANLLAPPRGGPPPQPRASRRWFVPLLASLGGVGLALAAWGIVGGFSPLEPAPTAADDTVPDDGGVVETPPPRADLDVPVEPAYPDLPVDLGAPLERPAGSGELVLPAPGGHLGMVSAIAVGPKGRMVLTGGSQGELRLFDAESGALLKGWEDYAWGELRAAAFDGTGAVLGVTRPHAVRRNPEGGWIYEGESHLIRISAGGAQPDVRPSGHDHCYDIDVDSAGRGVTGGNNGLRFWTPGELAGGLPPALVSSDPIGVARFNPAGGGIGLGGDGCVRWDEALQLFPADQLPGAGYVDLAWGPEGKSLATLSKDRDRSGWLDLYSWPDLTHLKRARVYQAPANSRGESHVRGLCFSADGSLLYTVGTHLDVRAWTVPELEPRPGWKPGWPSWTERIRIGPGGGIFAGGNDGQLMRFAADGTRQWGSLFSPLRGLKQVTEGALAWLDEEGDRLLLNADQGLLAVEATSGELFVQEPSTAMPQRFSPIVVASGRFYGLWGGQLGFAKLGFSGGRLSVSDLQSLPMVPEVVFSDLVLVDGTLVLVGSAPSAPGRTLLHALDPADLNERWRQELGFLGADTTICDVTPGARFFLLAGANGLAGFRLDQTSFDFGVYSPSGQIFYVAACAGAQVLVVDSTGWHLVGPGGVVTKRGRLPEAGRSYYAWSDSRLFVNLGDRVDLRSLESNSVLQSFPIPPADLAACLKPAPDGKALYVWTLRGELLRFPLRF